jgi:uncharacterized membrane protein YdjX (TVP38/TMEM64 family)
MLQIALGIGLFAALGAAWYLDLYEYASLENLEAWILSLGAWGPVGFVGLFMLGELLWVPSVLFVFVAGLIWPFAIAWPTAYIGANAASTLVFLVARYTVGDAARRFIPDQFLGYEERLMTKPLRTVVVIRLTTFLHPVMHWVFGVSRVSFRDLTLGTMIGLLPGVTLIVVVGDAALKLWPKVQGWVIPLIVVLVAVQVARRRTKPVPAADDATHDSS